MNYNQTEKDNENVILQNEEQVKTKKIPTIESVMADFDMLIESIDIEINHMRDSSIKYKGVKYLRSFGKKIKHLRDHTKRVLKKKNRKVKNTNSKSVNINSGFLKPVSISEELSVFTGWNATEPKSRVDVTRYICNYIKENNLQNPADRRQIIADKKLCTLLKFDPKTEEPLKYYSIQGYLKHHFIKTLP